jgi:pyruvate kinase
MLDSMIRNPRSTRAETSDIANAILDGADAIMLSGETSVGKYPKEAARAMNRIALDTEAWLVEEKINLTENVKHDLNKVPVAVAKAAFELAKETKSKFTIAATATGSNARQISKFRPYRDIIAGTDSEETARKLALSWGVLPMVFEFETNRELTDKISDYLVDSKLVKKGDYITLVSGITKGKIGGTNMVRIQEV